jgi:chorismate mutase/prephenate dehydrogenase
MSESSPPPDLAASRERIDAIDRQVLELLAERTREVEKVAAAKRTHGLPIRDWKRERALLSERKRVAAELGLATDAIESIYRQIMLASRDRQAQLGAASAAKVDARRIVVVGGEGAMGALFAKLFGDLGHDVRVADVSSRPSAQEAVVDADVVIISVPIRATLDVIRDLGPRMRRDALLMDLTSLKREPLTAMLAATEASVVGAHPLFGPGVHTLQGQRIVVCPGRGDEWRQWLQDTLALRGIVVTEASAEEHDRAMALVQVLTHFQTQVFGFALAKLGIPIEDSRRFTSPAYLLELYVAARHFTQSPELYGPIEMDSPERDAVTGAFAQAAEELRDILASRDQARFNDVFEEVRAFFGSFAAEATEHSSYLIDRLVERELG